MIGSSTCSTQIPNLSTLAVLIHGMVFLKTVRCFDDSYCSVILEVII